MPRDDGEFPALIWDVIKMKKRNHCLQSDGFVH